MNFRTELANNTALACRELNQVRVTIKDMEGGLWTWFEQIIELQTTVTTLTNKVKELKNKVEDMEGRMRRCNRILGVPEEPGSSSTASVSKVLKEVPGLQNEVLVDRSHRGLTPKNPSGKPVVIVAKLHYYGDCVEVLREARSQPPLRFRGKPIALFPDYTTGVTEPRAAFTEVRKILQDQDGVRYGILFPARRRITHNGTEKEFLMPVEAMAYVKKHIITAADDGTSAC